MNFVNVWEIKFKIVKVTMVKKYPTRISKANIIQNYINTYLIDSIMPHCSKMTYCLISLSFCINFKLIETSRFY